MADFVDSFGAWKSIGIISPNTLAWAKFPVNCIDYRIFRCRFDTDWPKWLGGYPYKSYGLIKEEYSNGSEAARTQWNRRIIPQQEPLIVDFQPIPFTAAQRFLLIKRFFWTSVNWGGHPTLDIAWQVTIEALEE